MKRKATAAPASPKQPKVAKKETEEKQLVVIQWLRENYYLGTGGSTPKALLFQDYLDMCRRESLDATSNSAFGKLVRTAFPGVQSSRKGPRGAAKHQYKNLLPIGEGPRLALASADAAMALAPLCSASSSEEDEYEEEISSSYTYSAAFGDSSSSSSPSASPHHYLAAHCQPPCAELPPRPVYFAGAGAMASSPLSSAHGEEGHELQAHGASSPTLSISYSSTPASSPVVLTSAEWMPPMTDNVVHHQQQPFLGPQMQPCQQQCCSAAMMVMPWNYRSSSMGQLELEQVSLDSSSSASSSFDDLLDAYDAEAAAAASGPQGMWDGDDVESFFSLTPAAAPYQLSSGHYASIPAVDFGVVGGPAAERRDEEAQLMWCSRSSVEDILSASKGEEWISNLLQGCN